MPDSATLLPAAPPLTPREVARLLPELTGEAAIRAGGIPSVLLPAGDWRLVGQRRRRQVIVIAEGFVAWRTSVVGGQSVTLAGPGDVLLPHGEAEAGPVARAIAWRPLTALRLAVIEERVLSAAGAELTEALLAVRGRAAGTQGLLTAASRIPRIERRVLTLLWVMGERWGRAGTEGIQLDLPIAGDVLALVAATDLRTAHDALDALLTNGRIRSGDGDTVILPAAQTQALERTHASLADGVAGALEEPLPTAITG